MSAHLRHHTDQGVLTLTLDRPEKRNALTPEMYLALAQSLASAAEDATVNAVLLLGHAGAFSSGNDVETFMRVGEVTADAPVFRFMHALAGFPKPVVAAVDGMAIGIGATLLLHCDLIYASPRARLQFPFVRMGLCPEFAASLLLPRLLGRAWASEALLLGEAISAVGGSAALRSASVC